MLLWCYHAEMATAGIFLGQNLVKIWACMYGGRVSQGSVGNLIHRPLSDQRRNLLYVYKYLGELEFFRSFRSWKVENLNLFISNRQRYSGEKGIEK